ncbi:hypothetical protein BKK51_09480 [Rodentibacter trehalosifermentans]|uniref:Uncharacterized protein n=2 Tax=Rodentibacter TaxID=1960084 RepID=A0A1V3IPL2_9PAST|nr:MULTISPECIES: hypothetical protein [Rodentibacter]OOF43829.1 hypothetical protein BKK50_03990 [Rodentibacter rarus]OOF44231.1 hypothetical protein BKK51_09480 [Rodentibacter trehalosifermentans]
MKSEQVKDNRDEQKRQAIGEREVHEFNCQQLLSMNKSSGSNMLSDLYQGIIGTGHDGKSKTMFEIGFEGLQRTIERIDMLDLDPPYPDFTIEEIARDLAQLKMAYLVLMAFYQNTKTVNAKINGATQRKENSMKQKAIDEAKKLWEEDPRLSLDNIANTIINKNIASRSQSTIKQWISPHNPNRKAEK